MTKIIGGFLLLLCSFSAKAVIIGGDVTGGSADVQGGIFVELSIPFNPPLGTVNSVGQDTFNTPNLYAFNEGQNISTGADLSVNVGGSGGVITAGTLIASHYIFFDPANALTQTGWVEFDADILGIITSTNFLSASDSLLVNNNVNYLNPGARGLEGGDSATIDSNIAKRLNVNWFASSPGDFVRVITGFSPGGTDPCSTNPPGTGGCPANGDVPVPGSLALMGLGLAGLGISRRYRKSINQ